MKVLIMGFGKIKFMPYLNIYLENIDREKNDVHLLYWNRDLQEEDTSHLENITLHEFRCYQKDDVSKLTKSESFLKYRAFALSVLKKEGFDFLYIVHSLTGVVVCDYVCRNYKNKYIFDYRDFTYEDFLPFKGAVGNLVRNSRLTFVSSDAFRIYLPPTEMKKIRTIHNMDMNKTGDFKLIKNKASADVIRIGFWGFIRDEKINRKIIEAIGTDSRFQLHYYGREQQIAENLKSFVIENNINNVFFHGEYNPDEKFEFIKNIDLIHNIYDDKGAMLALGNKFYDSLLFKIPQVCMPCSFMGRLAEKDGVGFTCNPYTEGFTDKLYNGLNKLQRESFEKSCNELLRRFTEENRKNIDYILQEI